MQTVDGAAQSIQLKRLSYADGFFYSLMVGVGETYIVAYAMMLGMSGSIAAGLAVMPVLIGAIFQLIFSTWVQPRVSDKSWVLVCAIAQAFSLLLFALLGMVTPQTQSDATFGIMFTITSLYWASALGAGPPWNRWVSDLLPQNERAAFFIKRSYWTHGGIVIALLGAAYLLYEMEVKGFAKEAFIMLMFMGMAFRIISTVLLWKHPQGDKPSRKVTQKLENLKSWLRNKEVIMMILFSFLSSCAVHISVPYFTPFMIDILKLDYYAYTILVGSIFFARVLTNRLVLFLNNILGARSLLMIGTIGIVPISYLWSLGDNYWYLIGLQIMAGFLWSCHEMGISLYLLESMESTLRSSLLSWVNLCNSSGMVLGILLSKWFVETSTFDQHTYYALFTVSSIARMIPVLLLVVWMPDAIPLRSVTMRVLAVRPFGQAVMLPILYRNRVAHFSNKFKDWKLRRRKRPPR